MTNCFEERDKHMSNPKKLAFVDVSRQELLRLLCLFLVWRGVLFGVGVLAPSFLPYEPSFPYADAILAQYHLPQWLYSWANFDGVHYLTIAEKGYVGTGLIQAFFPFLPFILLHSLYLLTGGHLNTLLTGLVITNVAMLFCLILWYVFLKSFLSKQKAWFGVVLLLVFPTSLFFGALYTESIFLAAVIGAFLAARKQSWIWCSMFTLIATATRIVGVFLLPALAIEAWLQWREQQGPKLMAKDVTTQLTHFLGTSWRQLVLIGIGGLGTVFYMVYLAQTFGDPLYFLHVQSEFGAGRTESLVIYPKVLWRSIKILLTLNPLTLRYYSSALEFLAGSLGLLGLVVSAWKVRLSYLIFALGAFFLPTFTGTFSSMPRYLLVCFPLYLLLIELLATRPQLRSIVLGIFIVSLVVNTILFIQGYWVS